jgi:hypothetical protein
MGAKALAVGWGGGVEMCGCLSGEDRTGSGGEVAGCDAGQSCLCVVPLRLRGLQVANVCANEIGPGARGVIRGRGVLCQLIDRGVCD